MKKISAVFCALLCVVLISGCSFGGSDQGKKSSSSESSSSSQAASGSSAQSDQNTSSSGRSSDSSAENDTSAADVLNEIRSRLQGHSNLRLPSSVPTADGKYLSAQVESSSDGYSVTFKQTNHPVKINDVSLKNAKTIATVKAVTYASKNAAQNQISYHKYGSTDGSSIDLGYHITGYADAGAGTAGISWNEGRWTLAVLSPTSDADKGTDLAKQIVKFLEKTALPAPQPYGTIQIYTDSRKDIVRWQNNKTIYTVSDTSNPTTLLSITSTVK